MRRGTALLALAIVALTLGVACAGDDGDEASGGGFVQMLRVVPDEPQYRAGVRIGSFARYFELTGAARTPDAATELTGTTEARHAVLFPYPMNGLGVLGIGGPQRGEAFERLATYFGVGFEEIDYWLETTAGAPPRYVYALGGRFQPDAVDALLAACAGCPEAERREAGGVSYYAWGGDLQQSLSSRLAPPAFDQLGLGGRIAVLDDYVLRAAGDEGIESMLVALDEGASLADNEDFRLLAEGLEALGALGGTLTENTWPAVDVREAVPPPLKNIGVTTEDWRSLTASDQGSPLLRPYVALAGGPANDAEGAFIAVVLVHETEDAADENVRRLEARLDSVAELLADINYGQFASVEVEAKGRVLTAKLRGATGWPAVDTFPFPYLLHE